LRLGLCPLKKKIPSAIILKHKYAYADYISELSMTALSPTGNKKIIPATDVLHLHDYTNIALTP